MKQRLWVILANSRFKKLIQTLNTIIQFINLITWLLNIIEELPMKITELNKYLSEYVSCDAIKSLLINGKWGTGKTYTITQFLKNISSNKDIKAHYCSLFGCPDIDTLHQQLYAKFHPHKVRGLKALSYVPLALNLTTTFGFETGIDTAQIANDITANQINKSIKVKEKLCLVIFDDLERMANNSTIKMEELLGYFNRLRLENIKIIKEIESWLRYCPSYFTNDILNDIVNRILELSKTKTNKDIINAFLNHEYVIDKKNALLTNFYELLKTKNKQNQESWCIEYFKTTIDNLNNYSGQFSQLQHFLQQNNINIPKEIVDSIVNNNFFIPDLSNDINVNLWDFCHSMCHFVVNKMPNHKEQLKNYLLSLKDNSNSKCLSERVQSLIDYAIDNVQKN